MKFLSLLALIPAAVSALEVRSSLHGLDARQDSPANATGELTFDSLSNGNQFRLDDGNLYTFVGQEKDTGVSLFSCNGQVMSLIAAQGAPIKTYPSLGQQNKAKPIGLGDNGICNYCSSSDNQKRDEEENLEKRTGFLFLGILGGLAKVVTSIFGGICDLILGCLFGYHGGIHVGGSSCSVGKHGYLHFPGISISHHNGIGGQFCGWWQGTQIWHWQDGTGCPITIKPGHVRPGCGVKHNVCDVCQPCSNGNFNGYNVNQRSLDLGRW